jgi:integral membrane protein
MKKSLFTTPLGWLRLTGFLEGLSFLILLCIAMPLKYYAGKPEAVKHVGMGHGLLFILYVFLVLLVGFKQKWSLKEIMISLICSLLPLGTFYAEWAIFSKKQ